MSYSFAKKIFPNIQRTYFDVFFSAESIGTLSFADRARFSGEKGIFLNAEKLKKFSRFLDIFMHTLFYILKYKVSKLVGLTLLDLKFDTLFLRKPNTYILPRKMAQ